MDILGKNIDYFSLIGPSFAEEVEEKIELLKDKENHKLLKIHKLHGRLAKWYSFSVNYRIRIIFSYLSKQEIVLLAIGDHEVYDK